MTTQNKKRDDEVLMWAIGGGIFTAFMIIIDWFYSSFDQMPSIVVFLLYFVHGFISLLWIISFAKWKDPNYDVVRKCIVFLCLSVAFCVGVHHSVSREDKQVLIDSKENAAKP